MDRVLSAQIRVLCGVKKGVNEGLDKSVLQWFSHIERMGNDTIAKRRVLLEQVDKGILMWFRHMERMSKKSKRQSSNGNE